MKQLLTFLIILLIASSGFAQYDGAITLNDLYEYQGAWTTLDGAGASTTFKFEWAINQSTTNSNGSAWGSMALWVQVDTLKADISTTDSLQVTFKELKGDANATSYTTSFYDSTTVDATFNWTSGKWKRWNISPGIGQGIEVRFENDSARDDSIRVRPHLIWQ